MADVIYAYLCQEADAADRVATPIYLTRGMDPDRVRELAERERLDEWLAAPDAAQAAAEKALLSYVTGG